MPQKKEDVVIDIPLVQTEDNKPQPLETQKDSVLEEKIVPLEDKHEAAEPEKKEDLTNAYSAFSEKVDVQKQQTDTFDDFNDEFDISLPHDEPAQKKADLFDDDFDDGGIFDDEPKKPAPKFDDLDFDF